MVGVVSDGFGGVLLRGFARRLLSLRIVDLLVCLRIVVWVSSVWWLFVNCVFVAVIYL